MARNDPPMNQKNTARRSGHEPAPALLALVQLPWGGLDRLDGRAGVVEVARPAVVAAEAGDGDALERGPHLLVLGEQRRIECGGQRAALRHQLVALGSERRLRV